MTNNLISETSPYLLQHKDNPVKWFSWNSKTLSFAKIKNCRFYCQLATRLATGVM